MESFSMIADDIICVVEPKQQANLVRNTRVVYQSRKKESTKLDSTFETQSEQMKMPLFRRDIKARRRERERQGSSIDPPTTRAQSASAGDIQSHLALNLNHLIGSLAQETSEKSGNRALSVFPVSHASMWTVECHFQCVPSRAFSGGKNSFLRIF